MSKIQSLNPHHSSSPSQCQLECTERSESLSEQRNMPFKPESSFQHCRIRNTVTIASYLRILLGTALTSNHHKIRKTSCKSCVSFHTLLRSVQEKWHTDLHEHPKSCKLWLTKQSSVLLLTTKIK